MFNIVYVTYLYVFFIYFILDLKMLSAYKIVRYLMIIFNFVFLVSILFLNFILLYQMFAFTG